MKQIKVYAATLAVAVLFVGCAANLPPNLSPQARVAWESTQTIKALDVVRDVAIAANDAKPSPLLSTATTRAIVKWHEDAIGIAHAAPAGWSAAIRASLDGVLAPLSAHERAIVAPYVALAKTVLKEAQP